MSQFDTFEGKLAWAKANPSYCLFPYSTLDLRVSTRDKNLMALCCCNLKERAVDQTNINDPFADVKRSMESGILPDDCRQCINEESMGGTSERIRGIVSEDPPMLEKFSTTCKPLWFEVRIKFGNICVQACRSCSPTESNLWGKISKNTDYQFLETDITDFSWELITDTILKNIYKSDYFYLHLIGGETLIQPGVRKLLNWVIDQGLQHRIRIRATTSLGVIPEGILDLFKHFFKISLCVSIDSVGDNYKFVRWPINWNKIQSNFTELTQYIKQNQLESTWEIQITPVFTLNNIFYIVDYLDFWYHWFLSDNSSYKIINTNATLNTQHLDVQALPLRYREILKNKLIVANEHRIFLSFPDKINFIKHFISTTVNELEKWPENEELWDGYLKFTAAYDARTNSSFPQSNSQLYELLTDQDKNKYHTYYQTEDIKNTMLHHIDFLPNNNKKLLNDINQI